MLSYEDFKATVEMTQLPPGCSPEFPLDLISPCEKHRCLVVLQQSKSDLFSYDSSGTEWITVPLFKYTGQEIKDLDAVIDACYVMYLRLNMDFKSEINILIRDYNIITGEIEFGMFMYEVQ